MSAFDLNDFSCLNKKLNSANINTTQTTSLQHFIENVKKIKYSNSIIEENFYIHLFHIVY